MLKIKAKKIVKSERKIKKIQIRCGEVVLKLVGMILHVLKTEDTFDSAVSVNEDSNSTPNRDTAI